MTEKLDPARISPTFCLLPWVHLSTRPNGHLRLCCTANASSAGATNDKIYGGEVGILKKENGKPANLNTTGLLEGWNNEYMRDVRLTMLNGGIPASCSKCFKEEASGVQSKRQWETKYWSERVNVADIIQKTSPDGTVPPHLVYLDLRLGSKCNLKCIMCSPHDSSMWVPDWLKLHPKIENESLKQIMSWDNRGKNDDANYNWHLNNPRFWDELYDQIPNMQQLYFAGGEPLIIDAHFELLEQCVKRGEAGHIELRYNSNGLVLPEELLELWNHFKRVRFGFSLDGYGKHDEYIRYPTDFSVIEKNLRRLDETPDNIEVTIACAVQMLNMYYIPDFIQWKLNQGYKKINPYPLGAGLINMHGVYHPAMLNIKVFPKEFKKKIARKYEGFDDYLRHLHPQYMDPYGLPRLRNWIKFMFSEDWSARLPEFQEYITRMDEIRGTRFTDTFPEMAELMDGTIR